MEASQEDDDTSALREHDNFSPSYSFHGRCRCLSGQRSNYSETHTDDYFAHNSPSMLGVCNRNVMAPKQLVGHHVLVCVVENGICGRRFATFPFHVFDECVRTRV